MTPYQFDQFLAESHPEDYILGGAGIFKAGIKGLSVILTKQAIKMEVKAVSALELPEIIGKNTIPYGTKGATASVNSEAELNLLYEQLTKGGSAPVSQPWGTVVTLKDGTTVALRPTSKSGGATIEINYKQSLGDNEPFKIHINQ